MRVVTEEASTLGERLRRKRKALRVNQQHIAERFGVHQSTIAKWENDVVVPGREHVAGIAALLDVAPTEVFEMLAGYPTASTSSEAADDDGRSARLSRHNFYALSALASAQGTSLEVLLDRAITTYLRGLK